MKGTYLGEFQELVLLTILILEEEAYGVMIQEEIYNRINREVSRGALHTALTRLEEKGFLKSELGGASAIRGGRRKRIYQVTSRGNEALETAKNLRDNLWSTIAEIRLKPN